MLQYRDFVPQMKRGPAFLRPAEFESFEAAVAAAGAWIQREAVEVVNVETVVLPNLWREEGSTDPELHTSGMDPAFWYQFIRVWYRS